MGRSLGGAFAGLVLVASVLVAAPSAPAAVAAPAAPAGAGYLTPVDGGNLRSLVVSRSGHAFATNPTQNRIDVLSLTTGLLEPPITVGSGPVSLDLSADEGTLYVANFDGNDISVVDVASRHETGRIPLPAGARPSSIAISATGTALVARTPGPGSVAVARTLSVDLEDGTVEERLDWNYYGGGGDRTLVQASGDRTRIGIVRQSGNSSPVGAASFYDVATDSFGPDKFLKEAPFLAVDRTGSKLLVASDTIVLDGDLVVRATAPGTGTRALAMSSSGTTAFRLQENSIEVIDVARGLVTSSIALPDPVEQYRGALAVTPDNTTLVALTTHGFSVAPVNAAAPVPCPVPTGPAGVVRFCGAPLADVVVDARGRAYASNTARNQIEVVSLPTRSSETPIPVGSQPTDIDLSPDGNTLYVVNSGAEEVSVVDLTLRLEVGRITVASTQHADRPLSFAAASNGVALLTTRPLFFWSERQLLEVNLLTGAVRPREDYVEGRPSSTERPMYVEASGDGSRIVALESGATGMFVYDTATDSFGPRKEVSGVPQVAVDASGSTILTRSGVSDTKVFDRELVVRATIPASAYGHAINAAGTTGYRFASRSLEILDLSRGLVKARIPIPEYGAPNAPTPVAVTADEATVVAVTASGLSVGATNTAVPAACPSPTAPPSVAGICGAPLAEMVVGGDRIYASNPNRNQIEVVSLSTGGVEAPIPVGSQPRGLDLSPDGTMLYVANRGAQEVSVVDLVERREVRRITIPSWTFDDHPLSIAVADNGMALLTTANDGSGYGGTVWELDPTTGTATPRLDAGTDGRVTIGTVVRATADRAHIAMFETQSLPTQVSVYTTQTNTFTPMTRLDNGTTYGAVNGDGSRFVFGEFVLDGSLTLEGTIPAPGKAVAVNRSGSIGYRVQDTTVEVLDLDTRAVVRSVDLPEPVGVANGNVVLGPDESTLAVLTSSGISLLRTPVATPRTPVSVWRQTTSTPLDGLGAWIAVVNDPIAAAGQSPPAYFYGQSFGFARSAARGTVGLVTGPAGKLAMFTLVEPDGAPRHAVVPFEWNAGGFYFLFVYRTAPGTWSAWAMDNATSVWTSIGQLSAPPEWGQLSSVTVSMALWYGPSAQTCAAYPQADVFFSPSIGYVGTTPRFATLAGSDQTAGDCPASITKEAIGWVRYQLGSSPGS